MKSRILHFNLIPPAERLDSSLAGEDELDVRRAHGEGEDTEEPGTTRQLGITPRQLTQQPARSFVHPPSPTS